MVNCPFKLLIGLLSVIYLFYGFSSFFVVIDILSCQGFGFHFTLLFCRIYPRVSRFTFHFLSVFVLQSLMVHLLHLLNLTCVVACIPFF